MLSHNEVAAVSADREVYVSDEPSPYLSARTAKEDPQDTKRRHSLFVIVCALLCVAAATGGITWLLLSALKPSEILDVPTFDTIAIQAGEFVESIDTTALTQPLDERAVMPDVSGSIREVLTQEGAYVTEGDVLFQLDNPNITDAAAKAQETYNKVLAEADAKLAALNEANSALDNARAALEDAKTNAERITAQAAYDAALKHAEIVQTESNAAEATLQTVTETNNQAQAQLSTLVVHAPISGTITELNPGAVKSANVTGTTRLCVVSDMSSFRLQIEVPEQSRSRVNEGQLVKLKFPTIPDLESSSVISSIDYVGDLNVATVFIENPDERIQRGTAVETSIIVQSVPDSLMVPNEAIRIDEKGLAHLDILLDPTRGIHSDVVVTIIAQDSEHAAVQASNIQEGNAAIIGSGGEPEQVTEGTA
jgi:multidrug efflux pump subunit AcrA (membrane-fusion protein)